MLTKYDQVSVIRAAQYDGTNATELTAEFGAVVISEVAGVLTYADSISDPTYTVSVGEYVHWSGIGSSFTFASPTLLAFPYTVVPLASLRTVTGSGNISASLLGGPQNIGVNLSGALAAGYIPLVFLRVPPSIAPSVLSGHAVTGVTVDDADTVTVHIQSGVGSLAGGQVYVVAQETRTV